MAVLRPHELGDKPYQIFAANGIEEVCYLSAQGKFNREQDSYYNGKLTSLKRLAHKKNCNQGTLKVFSLSGEQSAEYFFKVNHKKGVEYIYRDRAMKELAATAFLNRDSSTNHVVNYYPSGRKSHLFRYDGRLLNGCCEFYSDCAKNYVCRTDTYIQGVLSTIDENDPDGFPVRTVSFLNNSQEDFLQTEYLGNKAIEEYYRQGLLLQRDEYVDSILVAQERYDKRERKILIQELEYDKNGILSEQIVYDGFEYDENDNLLHAVKKYHTPQDGLLWNCAVAENAQGELIENGLCICVNGLVAEFCEGEQIGPWFMAVIQNKDDMLVLSPGCVYRQRHELWDKDVIIPASQNPNYH